MSKSSQGGEEDDKERGATTDFPEIILGPGGIDDAGQVHAIVGGEEGERQEDDRYDGEDEDSFVLAVGNYG